MKNVFKKSIACVLALALCLSLCVCSLTASADAPAYSTEPVSVYAGESATIKFAVSNFFNVKGAMITLPLPEVVDNVDGIKLGTLDLILFDDENGGQYIVEDVAGRKSIKFLGLFGFVGELDSVETLTFDIAVDIKADVEAKAYEFGTPVFQVTEDGETLTDVTGAFGTFEVVKKVATATLDEDLVLFNVSAGIQDSLSIGYIIMNNTYNTKYARIEMEVVANKYNGDRDIELYTTTLPFTPLNGTSTTISNALYSGIAMFEIDQTVTAKIKAYDAEGNYVAYSKDYVNDPVSLLKALYTSSTSDLYKTMVTDMFNLGTAAQAYFGNVAAQTNPDNDLLANYNANPINKDWDQTYASEGMPELTLANSTTWDENSPLAKADLTFMANMNLAATPSVGYLFKLNTTNYTLDDIRIEVSYDAVYPKAYAGTRTETFTAANFGTAASFKTAIFTKMTLTDSNREVTAKVYCDDKLVLTSVYTMDQGIQTQAATAGAKDLATALGQFETAARNYFASIG